MSDLCTVCVHADTLLTCSYALKPEADAREYFKHSNIPDIIRSYPMPHRRKAAAALAAAAAPAAGAAAGIAAAAVVKRCLSERCVTL
jgi:hypothetical protein